MAGLEILREIVLDQDASGPSPLVMSGATQPCSV